MQFYQLKTDKKYLQVMCWQGCLKKHPKQGDITGGLPRVAELFEARRPKDSAIIAENDGVIEFGKEVRGKQKISIVSSDGITSNYLLPKGKHVNFNQGEKIKKGEYLLDGSPAPHDILRILGVEKLTEYLLHKFKKYTDCKELSLTINILKR